MAIVNNDALIYQGLWGQSHTMMPGIYLAPVRAGKYSLRKNPMGGTFKIQKQVSKRP